MKLYQYLCNLYNSREEFKEEYTLDNFMCEWLEGCMASESLHETFINEEFIGYHYRSYEIDHEKKMIDFIITESLGW